MSRAQAGTGESRNPLRETLLVVEGGEFARHRLKSALRRADLDIFLAGTVREGLAAMPDLEPDAILVSLECTDLTGVRAIDVFLNRAPGIPVIALTEVPTVDGAVEAMRHGAVDYLGLSELQRAADAVDRALREVRLRRELLNVQRDVRDRYGFSQLLTQSPRMLQVFDQIRSVAGTDATVLIRGETGTGKELVSRAIHERSKRKELPFVAINCGAFTESLLESELFGHEKGSFTGAIGRREGLFEMADGGSLFLDELGETTLNVQVNLLRVLEEMTFRRVGGRDLVSVDVRIIAATNVDLETAVENREFREDLYYRLNVFPIQLPPMRERREDIPLLMRHFLDEVSQDYELDAPMITAEALQCILNYGWPGNVRQLRAMCERWVITRTGQRLELSHLPRAMTGAKAQPDAAVAGFHVDDALSLRSNADRAVQQVERAYIYKALRRCEGHLEETAKACGISRRTLYTKLKQYRLEASDFKSSPEG